MTELKEAIEHRCSRRRYLPIPLKASDIAFINQYIEEFRNKENLKMHLILDNGDAFSGLSKSYGMFTGVTNYIAQVGNKADILAMEKLGYYGEMLVLHATALGLGTCWVGGTYDKSSCPVMLNNDESIVCTIVVGNVDQNLSAKEKLLRWGIHRKTKTVEQMYRSDSPIPDWFLAGMDSVQKAPSGVNRQPVMFTYKDGVVTASIEDIKDESYAIDLGIAKLHFELGAGGGKWDFGNGAAFTRS